MLLCDLNSKVIDTTDAQLVNLFFIRIKLILFAVAEKMQYHANINV